MGWHMSGAATLVAAACVTAGVIGSPDARAQDTSPAYVVSYIESVSAKQQRAAQLVSHYAADARKAAGNLRFDALQRIDRPNQFAFVAVWKDQKTAESFAASEVTKQFRERMQTLLSAPQDDRPSTGLDVGKVAPGRHDRGAIYVVTHVDIIPPKKDEGIAALKDAIPHSRGDAGNMRYDLLQQTSRPNHFTLVEIWRNRKALEDHEGTAHMRKLRGLLLPMGGALYDQRLYHSLGG